MQKLSTNETPNAEDNFVSLAELITDGKQIGVLATAIEKYGIYTWDRFGRFDKATQEDKDKSLELLAKAYQWSTDANYGRETQSPLDEFLDTHDNPYENFGWVRKACPDFNAIAQGIVLRKIPQQKSADTRVLQSLFSIIIGLSEKAGIDLTERGVASKIRKLVELSGLELKEDTIRDRIMKIIEYKNLNAE